MAAKADPAIVSKGIIDEVSRGEFAPVYLLMGEEPYYVDVTAAAIIERALPEEERDFNQFVMYGADTEVDDVIANARRYPMFSERTLVVLKEAQQTENLEDLLMYTENPLDSTVLVIVYRGNLDKRKALYKSIVKTGKVLESPKVRDYEISKWIMSFYASRGLQIAPDAAELLGESAGVDINRIVGETDKMLKNLPSGTTSVSVQDVEANVGVSREFSAFELAKHLSMRNASKALRCASYLGCAASFHIAKVTAALFFHFYKVLRYEAFLMKNPSATKEEKAAALGVSTYFVNEYDIAVRNYPLKTCMRAIQTVKEYDFKGKGGDDAGETSQQELLTEMVLKILKY